MRSPILRRQDRRLKELGEQGAGMASRKRLRFSEDASIRGEEQIASSEVGYLGPCWVDFFIFDPQYRVRHAAEQKNVGQIENPLDGIFRKHVFCLKRLWGKLGFSKFVNFVNFPNPSLLYRPLFSIPPWEGGDRRSFGAGEADARRVAKPE